MCLSVQISPRRMDTRPMGLGPSFQPEFLCKDPVTFRGTGVGLTDANVGGHSSTHNIS